MVTLDQLQKKFGNQHILQDISLKIETGSKTVLLGSNGSGKSTLIKILSGAVEATEHPPLYHFDTPTDAAQAGMICSIAAPYVELNPMFTLNETVRFHAKMCGFLKDFDPQAWIDKAGLRAHQNKRLKSYSSGMQQRVRLLLAIGSDRPLLLLDEPTSNLDKSGIEWYQDLIAQYTKDKTVVVASNYVAHEYEFCNQELLLEKHY